MIPSDLAARLRVLAETAVQPLAPVQEIGSELPEFSPGERFTAKIETALPSGNFRATVAGRAVTLSLPLPARAGDTLDLVVVENTPQHVVARPTDSGVAGTPAPTLSRTARLIGSLLAANQGAVQPAPLRGGTPVFPQAPTGSIPMAALLQEAVSESGLFYEAHQAQWLAGRLPVEALQREPQGRMPAQPDAEPVRVAAVAAQRPAGVVIPVDEALASPVPAAAPAGHVPSEIAPLVQQQLEAISSHHVVWVGQIWPGQQMEWHIDEPTADDERHSGNSGDERPAWNTSLKLTLPRLGSVQATLSIGHAGVAVALTADDPASATLLDGGQTSLASSFAAAGVALIGFAVQQHEPD
jgi:hypothetical protein